MSSYISGTPEDVAALHSQLDNLWWHLEPPIIVDALARAAMYETLGWEPSPSTPAPQPLQLRQNGRLQTLYIVAPHHTIHDEDRQGAYPVDARYQQFFSPRSDHPRLHVRRDDKIVFTAAVDNELVAVHTRRLGEQRLSTFSIGTHLALERLVLASGEYDELPEERARIVAEFSAFAEDIKRSQEVPQEFPSVEQLMPFILAMRALQK